MLESRCWGRDLGAILGASSTGYNIASAKLDTQHFSSVCSRLEPSNNVNRGVFFDAFTGFRNDLGLEFRSKLLFKTHGVQFTNISLISNQRLSLDVVHEMPVRDVFEVK